MLTQCQKVTSMTRAFCDSYIPNLIIESYDIVVCDYNLDYLSLVMHHYD